MTRALFFLSQSLGFSPQADVALGRERESRLIRGCSLEDVFKAADGHGSRGERRRGSGSM